MFDNIGIPTVASTPNPQTRTGAGEWVLKSDTLTDHGDGWLGFIIWEHPDGLRVVARAYQSQFKVTGTVHAPTGEHVSVDYPNVGGLDSALSLLDDLLGGVQR